MNNFHNFKLEGTFLIMVATRWKKLSVCFLFFLKIKYKKIFDAGQEWVGQYFPWFYDVVTMR